MLCISSVSFAENIEQRVVKLENLLSSQVLMEQSQRLEQIQQELSSLRELMENHEHQLGLIKQRQRNLYQDMDRRLNDLEIKSGGSTQIETPLAPIEPSSSVPPPESSVPAPVNDNDLIVAAPVSTDKNGKLAYSAAFNTLKEGKYQQAILDFRAFQQNHPESVYAANAQYWLGEAYSVTRDYKTALIEFNKVVSDYSSSNKVADAMLKIGYTHYEMRDWTAAKNALQAVISKYPGTAVTRKSKERLQRMKREGH